MSTKKDKFSIKDKIYMKIAFDLARSKHGLTGSNPSVGSVIVKKDKIISVGTTSYNGRPHAEYNAIKDCIEDLKDSKIYITLEPCLMCCGALFWSQIGQIVYGASDIKYNTQHLHKESIHKKTIVTKGVLKEECGHLLSFFFEKKRKFIKK